MAIQSDVEHETTSRSKSLTAADKWPGNSYRQHRQLRDKTLERYPYLSCNRWRSNAGEHLIKAVRTLAAGSETLGGALLMANLLWQKHLGATVPWWFIGLAEIAGACSIAGGILLWREHRSGRVVSLVVQLLQILQVQARRFGYLFVAGVQLSVTVPPNPYLLHVGFFGSFSLRWHPTSVLMVGVNLFSLGVVILLVRGHQARAS